MNCNIDIDPKNEIVCEQLTIKKDLLNSSSSSKLSKQTVINESFY